MPASSMASVSIRSVFGEIVDHQDDVARLVPVLVLAPRLAHGQPGNDSRTSTQRLRSKPSVIPLIYVTKSWYAGLRSMLLSLSWMPRT